MIDKDSKIAILVGSGCEVEVSRNSGEYALQTLRNAGFSNTYLLEVEEHNAMQLLRKNRPDIVFNAGHGTFTEGGKLQAILSFLKIPYTHSSIVASTMCINKNLAKEAIKFARPNYENYFSFVPHITTKLQNLVNKDYYKTIVNGSSSLKLDGLNGEEFIAKPIDSGSSCGVFVIDINRLELATKEAEKLVKEGYSKNSIFIIEEFITGREINVVVVDTHNLSLECIVELKFNNKFCSYQNKYTTGGDEFIFDPIIDKSISTRLISGAKLLHTGIGCRDVSRSEFILTSDGKIYALEINSQPGLTSLSFVPRVLQHLGIPNEQLFCGMLNNKLKDFNG